VEVFVRRSLAAALSALVVAAAVAACSTEKQSPPAPPSPAPGTPPPGDVQKPPPADPGPAAKAAPKPREGGPSMESCEKFADHTGTFVADSLIPPNASEAQKQYAAEFVKQDRDNRLRFCLEALEQKEIDCVLNAVDFPALAACEKHRRQVPADLTKRSELTAEDCERFFVRYKQFMMNDGIPGERVDKDKDQIVRTCLEKAKPGTVACFITAETYEDAKRCP
jgi:hypothetical protein